MKSPRYSLRTLLALVALVGLLIGAWMMWSRSNAYRLRAEFHAGQERLHQEGARLLFDAARRRSASARDRAAKAIKEAEEAKGGLAKAENTAAGSILASYRDAYRRQASLAQMELQVSQSEEEDATSFHASAQWYERLAGHHAALKRKYRRAASMPWLAVAPDPPK